jgi:transcriptional regulator with XRE-family HTH domain
MSQGVNLNDGLARAMAAARMTEGQLARACEVDEKTVGRWLAGGSSVPHARNRYAACAALGVDEAVIWPDAIKGAVKTGPDREIVAVYPYRSMCPGSVWRSLINGANKDLTFAGYTSYFLWLEQPNLRTLLAKKAESGCRVRFLIGDPEGEVTRRREEIEAIPLTVSTRIRITLAELEKIRNVPGIEARYGEDHIAMSVFTFDDQMLVTPHLAKLVGHDSPLFHIRRLQEDGMYDRFASHVAELWSEARPVWE